MGEMNISALLAGSPTLAVITKDLYFVSVQELDILIFEARRVRHVLARFYVFSFSPCSLVGCNHF